VYRIRGRLFLKDSIKDSDSVGQPGNENKEDPVPVVPHENVSFFIPPASLFSIVFMKDLVQIV